MKSYVTILGAMVALFSVVRLCAAANDGKPSVKNLPPVVVKTVPASGDTRVDAAKVKAVRVTFSKNDDRRELVVRADIRRNQPQDDG